MPIEPQRFIHAANVRLDVPVSVQTAESLTVELREAFEDATIDSWAYVIDRCVALKVDYLLLSGNVFVESERSLRARLSLLRGFERLRAAGIPVVVIPGVTDPPEAWRSIPELPDNVSVAYSSASDPVAVTRGDQTIATVAASLWYGETDSFGIQVVSNSDEVIQPFRIGTVSEAGYHEARRMAELTREQEADDLALGNAADGWNAAANSQEDTETEQVTEGESADDESLSLDVVETDRSAGARARACDSSANKHRSRIWDAGFISFVDETFREGRLDYLAFMGDLERVTLNRGGHIVHGPGTTQPRHLRESDRGTCSLVSVSADAEIEVSDINTSSVDWKELEIHVDALVTLSTLLQQMKSLLTTLSHNESDCIWSIAWTLRGPLPVLKSLQEEDLDVAVAVELDVLEAGEADIELLHSIRIVPDEWSLEDSDGLGQQFADHVRDFEPTLPSQLRALLKGSDELTKGWRQRLSSLLPAMDQERILAQLRTDGADWFVPDPACLMPEMLRGLTEQPDVLSEDDDGNLLLLEADVADETAISAEENDDETQYEDCLESTDTEIEDSEPGQDERAEESSGDPSSADASTERSEEAG